MLALENADEILQILDRFTKQKSKDIPPELEEYIGYVAKTGDTVYRWPTVQYLFREKLRNVIKEFHDTTASIEDLPQCPNVDQFNYDSMKTLLFERFDNFQAAPFTVQRLCELLTDPKKHYSRLDKFMRALEKNILVVSTVEPGRKPVEIDDDHLQANGDLSADIISEIELAKNEIKLSTNGTSEKKQNDIKATESIAKAEVASSSGISATVTTATEDKAKETEIDNGEAKSAEVSVEKPATEPQTPNDDEEMPEAPKPAVDDKTVETKPAEPTVVADQKPEELEPKVVPEKVVEKVDEKIDEKNDEKVEDIQIDSKSESVEPVVASEKAEVVVPKEEKSAENGVKETVPVAEEVKNTPPTPKRAASASDDEEDDGKEDGGSSKNPCAKKIRLDLEEPNKVETPEIESTTISDVDLEKEADILDSISTEIDEQKENELLEEVDSALVADKDPINIDVQPIAEDVVLDAVLKSVENTPANADLLKDDEPVAIPAEVLDFTPDEALNDLVSSDILTVIPEQPEQPAEEVSKVSDEPAKITSELKETAPIEEAPTPEIVEPVVVVAEAATKAVEAASEAAPATEAPAATPVDEMNVESTEPENAMEAAPIKADEEKMDVDESNSTDAMDL